MGRAADIIRPAIEAALVDQDPAVRTVVAHHFGWSPGPLVTDGRHGGGKFLRGCLALTSAAAYGEELAGLPAAVAVELLHNFSLLHDDIMDGDVLRRHRPTAWRVFGVRLAMLAGDVLYAGAYRALSTVDGPAAAAANDRLAGTAMALLDGQARDISQAGLRMVTAKDCEQVAAAKTAALVSCAVALGAELNSAPAAAVAALATYGHHLGLAFQAIDDILGIWGDPAVTGKGNNADLREGKLTLPVVFAYQRAGRARARLTRALGAAAVGNGAVAAAADLVRELGGHTCTMAYAQAQLDRALAALRGLPGDTCSALTELGHFVVDRIR